MTAKHISSVEVTRLHGVFNLNHSFGPGINIIYGQNGAGKTTLLHILANALAGDYVRFIFLQFETIKVSMSDGTRLTLNRSVRDGSVRDDRIVIVEAMVNDQRVRVIRVPFKKEEERPRGRELESRLSKPEYSVSYFPAFRSMLDAWVSASREGVIRPFHRIPTPTDFARKLFGQFVPQLTYPSLLDIETRLTEEVSQAFRVASEAETGQMGQAAIVVFRGILGNLPPATRPPAELVEAINLLCGRIGKVSQLLGRKNDTDLSSLARLVLGPEVASGIKGEPLSILEVYWKALEQVASVQERAIHLLDVYLKTINSFLSADRKRLVISSDGEVCIRHDQDGRELSLQTLSSGERQIVAMVYEATHMSDKEVVLIDEPELSLHVDWQRPLLQRMADQLGDKQIIATTHSPVISSDFEQPPELSMSYASDPIPPEEFLEGVSDVRISVVADEEA